ncbi:MAG TPA: hypothetical protein VN628_03345 [Vicinamibacterales bacterium]|nr:hypothetical protein [Vicinamibacterales bacterium]
MKKWFVVIVVLAAGSRFESLSAHSGPPFPIVSDQTVHGYKVSVWTDPDVTDDETRAGRFWVTVDPAATSVVVAVKPRDRSGDSKGAAAMPVNGDRQRYYTALRLDHEGRYDVRAEIDGPRGLAIVTAYTDATYDLRPRPALTILFVLPFLLVGFVWGKLLLKRRQVSSNRAS